MSDKGYVAYPPITKSLSQRITEFAESLEQEQIENEKLHNELSILQAKLDEYTAEHNRMMKYHEKIIINWMNENDTLQKKLEIAVVNIKTMIDYVDSRDGVYTWDIKRQLTDILAEIEKVKNEYRNN